MAWWTSLATDEGARFDTSVVIDAVEVEPTVTWGTSPEDVAPIGGTVPAPESFADLGKQEAARKSLAYMGLEPGQKLAEVEVQNVFIGSCTNSRIEVHQLDFDGCGHRLLFVLKSVPWTNVHKFHVTGIRHG